MERMKAIVPVVVKSMTVGLLEVDRILPGSKVSIRPSA